MQTLSVEQLKQVAEMSGDKYFKSNVLKPFLRTRVPDTEGNRAVREVCLFFVHIYNTLHYFVSVKLLVLWPIALQL